MEGKAREEGGRDGGDVVRGRKSRRRSLCWNGADGEGRERKREKEMRDEGRGGGERK